MALRSRIACTSRRISSAVAPRADDTYLLDADATFMPLPLLVAAPGKAGMSNQPGPAERARFCGGGKHASARLSM
jgi:hypothetical protein